MGQGLAPIVLIVEDDQSCRELIAEVVQDLGFSVRAHDRAAQTLALIRKERPALVVLDKMLPDGDGAGVLRAIREDRDISSVPVLFCTAAMFDLPDPSRPRPDPYTAVITKPFHIDAFGQMIMELVAMSSASSPISQHP